MMQVIDTPPLKMTPEQFCYWLQGFSELNGIDGHPTVFQWRMIQDHLRQVFKKETPNYNDSILGGKYQWSDGIANVPYKPQWTTTTSDPVPGQATAFIC